MTGADSLELIEVSFNWANSYDAMVSVIEEDLAHSSIVPVPFSLSTTKPIVGLICSPHAGLSRLRSIIAPTLLVYAPTAALI